MPFYDLRCPTCEKEYNIYASITDKTEKRIPCKYQAKFPPAITKQKSPSQAKEKEQGPAENHINQLAPFI